MNIELYKHNIPKASLRKWTPSAIYCLKRGGICEGCIYKEAIQSTKYKMKAALLILTQKFGAPTKEDLKEFKEAFEKNKNKYERKNRII